LAGAGGKLSVLDIDGVSKALTPATVATAALAAAAPQKKPRREVDGWSLFIQFSKKKWGASRRWMGGTKSTHPTLTFSGLLQSIS
jgi:hypothetical protein